MFPGGKTLLRFPVIGAGLRAGLRANVVMPYLAKNCVRALRWVVCGREVTNFTYHLDQMNLRYLAALLADVSGRSYQEMEGYLTEVGCDVDLRKHIATETLKSGHTHEADPDAKYGRRVGWYALVRAIKPRVIVETGVDKGLGACLLASALRRNAEEGHAGHYYGTDIREDAGYLLSGPYSAFGTLLLGDSIESLKKLDQRIDLFINDSDHSSEYEGREYQVVQGKLQPDAIILGDNAHSTDQLLRFAQQTGRSFVFFQERPEKHWYPGAGIGIAFRRE